MGRHSRDDLESVLRWAAEDTGFESLEAEAESSRKWQIVKIEPVPAEASYAEYGFRSEYNGMVVGGVPSLELAEALIRHHLVYSFVFHELERQSY